MRLPGHLVAATVVVGLHLQGGVADAVAGEEQVARLVEHAVVVGAGADHEVGAGHLHVRRERPHVQVVHVDDAREGGEVALDGGQVEPGWRRLHEDAERLGAECHIPQWAEVGGAVGAAVARVKRMATVKVKPLFEPSGAVRFALYSRRSREVFLEMEDALARAGEIAAELAREDLGGAEGNDGEGLEVLLETAEERATDSWGGSLWLGTEIRAVARIAAREG